MMFILHKGYYMVAIKRHEFHSWYCGKNNILCMYTVHVQAQQEPVTLLFLTQGNKTQVTV